MKNIKIMNEEEIDTYFADETNYTNFVLELQEYLKTKLYKSREDGTTYCCCDADHFEDDFDIRKKYFIKFCNKKSMDAVSVNYMIHDRTEFQCCCDCEYLEL